MSRRFIPCLLLALALVTPSNAGAQAAGTYPGTKPPETPVVERLGQSLMRVGNIRVDTARREITVQGTVNPQVLTLEYIANATAGAKAYETALTLDTGAITFNTALLLIGLDKSRAGNAPTRHFDPATPEGDIVEISIECPGGECQKMPAEHLMYNRTTNAVASGGTWVYLGSVFLPDGRYMAHLDGVLVSFVHSPSAIIEYAQGAGLGRYGSIVMNPNLGLKPGTPVTMTLRAVGPATP